MSGWKSFLSYRCRVKFLIAIAFFVSVGICSLPQTAIADVSAEQAWDTLPPKRGNVGLRSGYCGVRSLQVCLAAIGCDIDPRFLLSPDYIGSHLGSSAGELVKAATNAGVVATCYSGLSHSDLMRADQPMILHVRASELSPEFDHWIAFLGYDNDELLIYDGHSQRMPVAELLSRWDGTAIRISQSSPSRQFLLASRVNSALFVFLVYLGLSQMAKRVPPAATAKRGWQQALVLIGAAAVTATAFHSVSAAGLFFHPTPVAEIAGRYYQESFPEVTDAEVARTVEGLDKTVLIDARWAPDFQAGAIPNAISVPINLPKNEKHRAIESVGKSERIVIYCQTDRCRFSDQLAAFMKHRGYRNIAIYRGGYADWVSKHDHRSL